LLKEVKLIDIGKKGCHHPVEDSLRLEEVHSETQMVHPVEGHLEVFEEVEEVHGVVLELEEYLHRTKHFL
jgi:hypothetical protein